MPFKAGNCANPNGRPIGSKNEATKLRDKYIKVFEDLGGIEAFLKFLRDDKAARKEFYIKVIPQILPRMTELDISEPFVVRFVMGDGKDNQTGADATEIHIE